MRTLIILRGVPGCGKTYWVTQNHLEDYTLSIDLIRNMYITPRMNHQDGKMINSFKEDNIVWNFLFSILELRMMSGEFTIIDAVHSKPSDFSKYATLAEKYRYRMYCVDFSDVPLNVIKERMKTRKSNKQVEFDVLENLYERLNAFKIPKYFKIIKPTDNIYDIINYKSLDVNNFNKIVFIGDIHGCWNPLEKYFNENPFDMNNLYIFVGDYFDRGIENDKVCQWLLEHYMMKNVMLLTGNHEKWFTYYANNEYDKINSKEFIKNTMTQLEKFDKKDLRQIANKFIQCAYIEFDNHKFICTHAGLGFMPENLQFIASYEMIRGGKYEDNIDKWFEKNNKNQNLIQVHGHRNHYDISINQFPHSINLNESVEFGKSLRIFEVSK